MGYYTQMETTALDRANARHLRSVPLRQNAEGKHRENREIDAERAAWLAAQGKMETTDERGFLKIVPLEAP